MHIWHSHTEVSFLLKYLVYVFDHFHCTYIFAAKLADNQPSLINYGKRFSMRAFSRIRRRALNISEQLYKTRNLLTEDNVCQGELGTPKETSFISETV